MLYTSDIVEASLRTLCCVAEIAHGYMPQRYKEKGNRPLATKHIHVVTTKKIKNSETGFEPRTLSSK